MIGVHPATKLSRNADIFFMIKPVRQIASPNRTGSGRDRGFDSRHLRHRTQNKGGPLLWSMSMIRIEDCLMQCLPAQGALWRLFNGPIMSTPGERWGNRPAACG
jgi:hypothetical protein